VLDFGVVSRQGRDTRCTVTVAGTLLGTPAFLAPELASPDGTFDGRSDLYSLGCVGFWLLTGRLPFEGDTMSLLMHHSKTPPSPPSTVAEERIPAALDAVILACMSKDPADRPATADILWERLDQIRTGDEWSRAAARMWWDQHAPELIEA
jgi:serine/threonine-protein kinase